MKKLLLTVVSAGFLLGAANAQERYLDEIYTDVDVESNVEFGRNWNFLLGSPTPNFALRTDVYEPNGDTESNRAAVILLHTGNFLPKYLNGSPTGDNKDSSIVASAEMFAKRGYVAFAPNYRLGWSATNVDPIYGADVRRGTLLNAVYRAINDAKTLVRYIKKSVAEEGNPYGVNPDRIIIYGHGSGGYVALAYGSLDRFEELTNEPSGKWLSTTTVPNSSFVANQPYLDPDLVGGINGFGGQFNDTNHFGYTNDVLACVNAGGALGDSAWIEAGEPPIISFHCPQDDYAPFTQGVVIVPTTQETVVDVVGSRWAIGRVNELGNNAPLYGAQPYTDDYTVAAETALATSYTKFGGSQELLNLNASDYQGLFPFILPEIQFPYQESSPWDFWEENSLVAAATSIGITVPDAEAIHNNGIAGSPQMSPARGKTYLDTIHGFLAPRLHNIINSNISVEENDFLDANTYVYPNPANDYLVVKTNQGIRITDVEIYNMTGALVMTQNNLNKFSHQINGINNLTTGLYLVKVTTDQGIISRRALVQ